MARGGPLRPQPPALPHLPAAGDMFRPPTPPRAAEATPPGNHAPTIRKPPPPSRRSRAPTGCNARIPPLPLEATLIYTTSQQSTVKTPTKITMTPRINQYLILKCFLRRYYLPDRGKASGTIFLRGGIQTLSKAS